jgi:N-methylhydantoinase B
MMRAQIESLPAGTVSAEDFLDNDGITDEPLKIALDLTIDGDRMVMDFSRSSPACAGPVNISRSTTIAACYVALKHIFGDVPANAGVLEPVEFRIAEDSLLSVKAPKPVGGYTETILRLIDVVFQAVAQDRAGRGDGQCLRHHQRLVARRPPRQRPALGDVLFFGGGHGAHGHGDGLNHGNAPISTATIPPLEILEAAYPVRFTQWALRPDSGGPANIAAASARSMKSNCWRKRPMCSCSANAASFHQRAWLAAATPRPTASSMSRTTARTNRRWCPR